MPFCFVYHAAWHAGSQFPDRGSNGDPAVEARSLNGWTAREEAPLRPLLKQWRLRLRVSRVPNSVLAACISQQGSSNQGCVRDHHPREPRQGSF